MILDQTQTHTQTHTHTQTQTQTQPQTQTLTCPLIHEMIKTLKTMSKRNLLTNQIDV